VEVGRRIFPLFKDKVDNRFRIKESKDKGEMEEVVYLKMRLYLKR
jgi:hypothetical protein